MIKSLHSQAFSSSSNLRLSQDHLNASMNFMLDFFVNRTLKTINVIKWHHETLAIQPRVIVSYQHETMKQYLFTQHKWLNTWSSLFNFRNCVSLLSFSFVCFLIYPFLHWTTWTIFVIRTPLPLKERGAGCCG